MRRCNPTDLETVEALAAEGWGRLEDFFPETAAGELEPSDPAYARNVIWDGISGRMLRAYPANIRMMSENIFDPDKLAAIVSGIDEASERLVFTAPIAMVTVVTPLVVKESILSDEDDPLTTGDPELDYWLSDPVEYLSNYFNTKKEQTALNSVMAKGLKAAVKAEDGDLGKLIITIRDGNHRAFGALIAGEPYIYVILHENQYQDLDGRRYEDKKILEALE